MASSDAKQFPVKNQAFRVTFPIFDADGDLVTGAAALDSEVSLDGAGFADCTNEATEIATSSGIYYLDLTSDEMNAATVAVIVKTSTAGAKTTPIILYPVDLTVAAIGVAVAGGADIAQIKQVTDKLHTVIEAAGGSPNEFRFTLDALRNVPSAVWDARRADFAAVGTFGEYLDASVSSRATQTSVDTVAGYVDTEVASILAAVDTEVAQIKEVTDRLYTTLEAAGGSPNEFRFSVDALRNVPAMLRTELAVELGRIDVAVSSRLATAGYTAPDNATITNIYTAVDTEVGTILAAVDTEVAAIKVVTDKLDSMVAPGAGSPTDFRFLAEAVQGVWDVTLAEHLSAGSTGFALNAAGSAGDPWSTALPGAYGAGTAGFIVGTNLDDTVSSRATQTSVDAVDDYVDTEVAQIKEVTDKLNTTLESAGAGSPGEFRFSADALRLVPSLVRTELTPELALVDVAVSTRLAAASYIAPDNATISAIAGYVDTEVSAIKAVTDKLNSMLVAGAGSPTDFRFTAEAVEQVWEAVLAEHLTAGSTGFALNAAGSAGDPWSTVIPGAYGVGTAGFIVGTNLDAAVSTLATQVSVDTLAGYVDTEVAQIKEVTDKLYTTLEPTAGSPNEYRFSEDALRQVPAMVRTELTAELSRIDVAISTRLAAASYTAPDNVTIAAIAGYVDTEVAAIKEVTDKFNTMLEDAAGSPGDYRFNADALANVPTAESGLTTATIATAVWNEALPGAYGAGTAGKLVGDNIDASISSRATQSSVNAIDDYVDTEVAAIKAVTDKLNTTFEVAAGSPGDVLFSPDALRNVPAMVRTELSVELALIDTTVSSRASQTSVDTIATYIDTEVAAIKAKTDNLPASPAATGDIPTTGAIADAVWDEGTAGHVGAGSTGLALRDADLRGSRTVGRGTIGLASTTTSLVTSAFSPSGAAQDQFQGRIIIFDNDTTTAALRGQATDITGNTNAATPTFDVTALTTAPVSGDTFTVV